MNLVVTTKYLDISAGNKFIQKTHRPEIQRDQTSALSRRTSRLASGGKTLRFHRAAGRYSARSTAEKQMRKQDAQGEKCSDN
jgi:hypothetical protein